TENDRRGTAAVDIGPIAAKRGNLHLVAVCFLAPDADDTEGGADGDGPVSEDVHDLFGSCAGGDVVVARCLTAQQVANGAAGPECLVPGVAEPPNNVGGEVTPAPGDRHRPPPHSPPVRQAARAPTPTRAGTRRRTMRLATKSGSRSGFRRNGE